jgi:hypothetical protein
LASEVRVRIAEWMFWVRREGMIEEGAMKVRGMERRGMKTEALMRRLAVTKKRTASTHRVDMKGSWGGKMTSTQVRMPTTTPNCQKRSTTKTLEHGRHM